MREEKYKEVHFEWWEFEGRRSLYWGPKGRTLVSQKAGVKENVLGKGRCKCTGKEVRF